MPGQRQESEVFSAQAEHQEVHQEVSCQLLLGCSWIKTMDEICCWFSHLSAQWERANVLQHWCSCFVQAVRFPVLLFPPRSLGLLPNLPFLPPAPTCPSEAPFRAGPWGSPLLSQRKRRKCCSICSASSALGRLQPCCQTSALGWAGRQKGEGLQQEEAASLALHSPPSQHGRTPPSIALSGCEPTAKKCAQNGAG